MASYLCVPPSDYFPLSTQDVAGTAAAAKPTDVTVCMERDCVYLWSPGQWSRCDNECGVGTEERQLTCSWDKGTFGKQTVPDSYCDSSYKPSLTRSCYIEDCVYEWLTSDWSSCSVTICGDGSQERTVTCQWHRNNGDVVTVADGYCYTARPMTSRPCSVECVYEWTTSSWGSCNGLCGEGLSKRDVFCEWLKTNEIREVVSNAHCVLLAKPRPSKSCDLQKCRYRWLTKDWGVCDVECGEGHKRRDVVCMWEDLLTSDGYVSGAEGAVVEDVMCGGEGLKPEHLVTCHAPHTCPEWHTTDWSKVLAHSMSYLCSLRC